MNSKIFYEVSCFTKAFAGFSVRTGGVSVAPYDSLNLGDHVGDDSKNVYINRSLLAKAVGKAPVYMQQIHSNEVREVNHVDDQGLQCDALITTKKNLPLAVMTADCLPLLLADEAGSVCAAVHCGWRPLAHGIVQKTVRLMREKSSAPLQAFIGPCIRLASFEVGPEVLDEFEATFGNVAEAFTQGRGDRWQCSLSSLTKKALRMSDPNVSLIMDCNCDTFSDKEHFFSYRRDGVTGRMASVIKLI